MISKIIFNDKLRGWIVFALEPDNNHKPLWFIRAPVSFLFNDDKDVIGPLDTWRADFIMEKIENGELDRSMRMFSRQLLRLHVDILDEYGEEADITPPPQNRFPIWGLVWLGLVDEYPPTHSATLKLQFGKIRMPLIRRNDSAATRRRYSIDVLPDEFMASRRQAETIAKTSGLKEKARAAADYAYAKWPMPQSVLLEITERGAAI